MTADDILSLFPFYRAARPAARELFRSTSTLVRLGAGAYYVRAGQQCGQLGLIGAGVLRVFRTGASGREITLYKVLPGESCLVNIACLLNGVPSPAAARAETDVEALVVPAGAYRRWLSESEEVRQFAFAMIATRLERIMTLVEDVAFSRLDRRLAEYLADRFDSGGQAATSFAATHEQIAADLGASREAVSRLLKDFERRGAVRLGRGRIALGNGAGLRALAGTGG